MTTDAQHIIDLYRTCVSKGRATLGELFGGHVEVESRGAWVTTASGRDFLNCGGYGVFITGAGHPTVIRAVERQLHRHPVSTRLFLEPQLALAAEALLGVCPEGLDRVYLTGSGAEAVETALKLARTQGRKRIISMRNGFHGKTLGALSVTAKDVFQEPFRPLLPGVSHVPYGDAAALEAELASSDEKACVIVEPVQGEAGVIVPPPGYLRDVAALCRTYDAWFILDEIQTGMGRLGFWWGADRDGVQPDILLVGKGLSGGVVPVSAVVATKAAFAVFDKDPYLHTSTFAGAPLAAAAARGAIQAIQEDDLVAKAARLGTQILAGIDGIVAEHLGDFVGEVRGAGLLIGVEFTEPGLAGDLLIELVEAGVIANHSLNSHLVLRFTPPAVLTGADVDFLLEATDRACRRVATRYSASPGRVPVTAKG